MTKLLRGDARHEIIKRARALAITEVERLVGVIDERRHLAVLAPEQLLDRGRANWIGGRRRRHLGLQTVNSQNHRFVP